MMTNRTRIFAASLATLIALATASPASAFIRLTRQGAGGPVVQAKWDDSELPLRAIATSANADITSAAALTVLQDSAETWENVNTSYFEVGVEEYAAAPDVIPPVLAQDGQNSIFFDNAGTNFPTAGVIAFVRSIVDLSTGRTLDADMVINDLNYWYGAGAAPAGQTVTDLQAVVTHEFGHFFGLDHTSVANSTMVPFISGPTQRTLELDDRAGISTIFPEGGSRPLSPGAVDFRATTGRIVGRVVSGYTGAAIFGAHVEAINIANPTPEASISAISGELTLRNGQGDFEIHGLPPGSYAVRIVPLDGVSTIAADGNVGGVFNGLDTTFEIEFWNAGGESGNGFTDIGSLFEPVSVAASSSSPGINFISNAYPGRVIVRPHGDFESTVTFTSNQHLAVRFDLPFEPPYTVSSVEFPSLTFNAQLGLPPAPAVFPSVSLCRIDPATGLPNLAAPLWSALNFAGSPNGINSIPVNVTITQPGETLFWVIRFPTFTGALPNFPFIRMDFSQHDRGFFAASYAVNLAGTGGQIIQDRNLVASLTVQMPDPAKAPLNAPSQIAANRRIDFTEFSYVKPADLRADGFPLPPNSLKGVGLLNRALTLLPVWSTVTTTGGGAKSIKLSPSPNPGAIQVWATQAIDALGHKSLLSHVTITGALDDADEPNGALQEPKVLALPVTARPETSWPAGDQDYFRISAKSGDTIVAKATAATPTAAQAGNDADLTMILFDGQGKIVAFNDDTTGLNPQITYTVPSTGRSADEKFTILVMDFYGSPFSPDSPTRVLIPAGYTLNVTSGPAAPPAP